MGIFSIFQGGGKYFDKKIPQNVITASLVSVPMRK